MVFKFAGFRSLFAGFWIAFGGLLSAQTTDFQAVERDLAGLSQVILNGDTLDVKMSANKVFSAQLFEALRDPASFDYRWDSLGQTVSILRPTDNSFRLFTWHIVNESNRTQYYYYFGIVQRRLKKEDGSTEIILIPLIEMPQVPKGVENMILDNNNWFGAQYYLSRNENALQSYNLRYRERPRSSVEKPKLIDNQFYLLFGWNGNDETSNFKLIETMSFDPADPTKVLFGAEVFYFDVVPKARAIFKYSDNAPFTLNTAYVRAGIFGKKLMVVYDHLADPRKNQATAAMQDSWEIGPDGSYDALEFRNGTRKFASGKTGQSMAVSDVKGYFQWRRNVVLAERYNDRKNAEKIEQQRYESLKAEFGEEEARRAAKEMTINERRDDKALKQKLEEQRAAERRRLQQAGIRLENGRKPQE